MAKRTQSRSSVMGPDPETVFGAFVRNANAHLPRCVRRSRPVPARHPASRTGRMRAIEAELGFERAEADRAEADRAEADRAEAEQVVPRLGGRPATAPPPLPPREASDDGQAPAGELDRVIGDMQVLLRYGHLAQVRDKLALLRDRYPEDLLLMRRITEFHLESGDADGALAALYVLAGRLYERRNFVGMRDALEQVLVLAPSDPRAHKLLALLDGHPSTGTGG